MMFPMFMDDEDETAPVQEESTSQRFQEPLPNTSVVEKSTKDECLLENKNEFEEGKPEKENECLMESQEGHTEERQETEIKIIKKSEGVNLPTNKTNSSLAKGISWNSKANARTLKENNPYIMENHE
ncbi:hypothetical protein M9H77_30062 [Catharanthus roseus]|uniref:Uncharacterized protein n=1 Tax=Catharanthus roseus TaxID=4058 RepID=A0ACB9ZX87_CATRO|nr:hypothetical protein M9H77_30062 [Catharanthus roseus]